MVHLAGVASLNDEAGARASALLHQVVVDRRGQQQRRDGGKALIGLAVRQHNQSGTTVDGLRDLTADTTDSVAQAAATAGDRVQAGDDLGTELGILLVLARLAQGDKVVVVQDWMLKPDATGGIGGGLQDVGLCTQQRIHAGDGLFAQRVQRRVGNLREPLREEVEQHARAVGQCRNRRV